MLIRSPIIAATFVASMLLITSACRMEGEGTKSNQSIGTTRQAQDNGDDPPVDYCTAVYIACFHPPCDATCETVCKDWYDRCTKGDIRPGQTQPAQIDLPPRFIERPATTCENGCVADGHANSAWCTEYCYCTERLKDFVKDCKDYASTTRVDL